MKKKILFILLSTALASVTKAGDDEKLTLKEKAEQSKTVKVFFNLGDIVDENDERILKASDKNARSSIRTALPADYANEEIRSRVITILNQGLELENVFVEGNIADLPVSAYKKSHYRELSSLPDGFYAIVDAGGEYRRNIQKRTENGVTVMEVSNSMEISSRLFFYTVTGGKVEKYGDMFAKSGVLLGNARSATVKSAQLENLNFMESTFPTTSLLEEYRNTLYRLAQDYAEKQLKKHNKAIAKRK